MTLLINILLGFYVFIALLMILVILMQRPKSEGLGAAFGGGVTENIFGAQTTNVLTKITSWLAALFFLLTFALSILYAHRSTAPSDLSRELMKDFPAAASPTPGPTAAVATDASATPGSTPTSESGTPVPLASPALASPTPEPSATPVDLATSATSTPITATASPDSVSPADPAATATPSTQPKRRRR